MGTQMSSARYPGFDWSGIPGLNRQANVDQNGTNEQFSNEFSSATDTPLSSAATTPLSGHLWGLGPAIAMPYNSQQTLDQLRSIEGIEEAIPDDVNNNLVPCVFNWTQGGHNVYLSGSFNDWNPKERIKLVRNGHEFTVVQNVPRGRHFYKFIVDDIWRYAPDQQTATDSDGNVNNIIDIGNHRSPSFSVPTDRDQARRAVFHQYIPEPSEYNSEAPPIPILFNKTVCPAADPPPRSAAPLHSIANHLYHDALAPNVFGPHISVMALTHRRRGVNQKDHPIFAGQKHSTCVFMTFNPLFLASTPQLVQDFGLSDPVRDMISKSFINCLYQQSSSSTSNLSLSQSLSFSNNLNIKNNKCGPEGIISSNI